jgi:hypothetical protein
MVLVLVAGATILGHFFAVTRTRSWLQNGWAAFKCPTLS